eukprot:CAMPEP_0197237186 /NCGR_PEP_ID=MMETSP1429-20130617/4087_1 /TAXON_ID=49237 /ORGANISM="Chaetoceros  sp., Strain UNC1202" /LENGTH=333 /DNA_ID=CAMNT_0042696147 /DNA_START=44 /DNA_END=1045 /DNA_ORIENTATION=+
MKIIFIGNPGTGKSTLLNGTLGKSKFKSGVSYGRGMTTVLQMEQDSNTGIWYGDTPGLADVDLRQKAAAEITQALKSGDDEYKLIFVVTEEEGRVRPTDVTTVTLVLDAITTREDGTSSPPYGIIVNKMTPKKIQTLLKDASKRNAFTTCLNSKYVTSFIHFYERKEELEDEANKVHPITDELEYFMKVLPSIRLKPEDIKDVKADEYAAVTEAFEKEIEELKNNSVKMQAKMKENEAKYLKQVENATSKIHKMEEQAKKKEKEMQTELLKGKAENAERAKKLEKELKEMKRAAEEHRAALDAMPHQQNRSSSSFGGFLADAIGNMVKTVLPF